MSTVNLIQNLCENLRKSISTLDTTVFSNQGYFIDYQMRMIEILKQMSITNEQINHSDNIRNVFNQLTCQYNELIKVSYGAIGTATTNDLAGYIRDMVKDLGFASIELMEKLVQNNSKNDIDISCRKLSEHVSFY